MTANLSVNPDISDSTKANSMRPPKSNNFSSTGRGGEASLKIHHLP
jgi:hypothetical protein